MITAQQARDWPIYYQSTIREIMYVHDIETKVLEALMHEETTVEVPLYVTSPIAVRSILFTLSAKGYEVESRGGLFSNNPCTWFSISW